MSEAITTSSQSWESLGDTSWSGGARSLRLPRGKHLGASLYELAPGTTGGLYHFHHGAEEMLIVIAGRATLRSPAGERLLYEGEVVHFVQGPAGAHQVVNRSDSAVRYVMVSTLVSPEAVEYPDTQQLSVLARTDSQWGKPLWDMRVIDPADGAP